MLLIALSFIVAFPLAHLLDSDLGTAGAQGFVITENNDGTHPSILRDKFLEYAQQEHISIGLEHVDAESTSNQYELYVTSGEESSNMAQWLRSGYSGFDPDVTIIVRDMAEVDFTDAGGWYHVTGNPEQVERLRNLVEEHGFSAVPISFNWSYYLDNPTAATILAMMLLIVTLATGGVLLRSRDYAIQRVHGASTQEMLWRNLRNLAPISLTSIAVCLAMSSLVLYSYNGLKRWDLYLQCCAALIGSANIFFILGIIISITSLHLVEIIPSLKGKIPGTMALIGTYSLRLISLIALLSTLGGVTTLIITMREQEGQTSLWEDRQEAEALSIATRSEEMYEPVGSALRAADERQDLLVAIPSTNEYQEITFLTTNWKLAHEEIGIDNPPSNDEVLLLIPEGTDPEKVKYAKEQVSFEADYANKPLPHIAERTIPADTEIFTYATSFSYTTIDPLARGAVIAVHSPGMPFYSDRNLSSAASQRMVFPSDSSAVERLVTDPGMARHLGGHQPAFAYWKESRIKATQQARTSTFNFIALALVVTATVLGSAAVYQTRHRQRLTVTDLMGGSPWRARLGLLAIEAAFLLVPAAWLLHRHRAYEEAALTAMPRDVLRSMAVTPELVAATIGISAIWALACLAMSAHLGRIYSRTPAR